MNLNMVSAKVVATAIAGLAPSTGHARPLPEVLGALQANLEQGLQPDEVSQRLAHFGRNRLADAPPMPFWRRLSAQFKDLVIWILITAAVVSGVMGEWVDTLAILAIVVLNGVIGFLQEERAGRALAALQRLSAPVAKALRGGELTSVPAQELVPGDIIEIDAGDNVPADARLFCAYGLQVQEAALTGESVPVVKDSDVVLASEAPLGDRRNMAYMGTVAAAGKGRGIVIATGMATELGRIAGMLERHEPEPTPLQRRLTELGRVLIAICLVIVALIFVMQVLRGGHLVEAFLVSVSLAVAAVPEGLPAVVTIALALGLQRMVKRNALVRKLPSVETLGSVTIICSDKTGTLTRNEMTVQEVVAGGAHYRVTGVGYAPSGGFYPLGCNGYGHSSDNDQLAVRVSIGDDLYRALLIGAICNDAMLQPSGEGAQAWRVIGDPTEGALLVAAMKAGIDPVAERRRLVVEIPFDSTRKAMSVIVREPDGTQMLCSKGAPEVILSKCTHELQDGHFELLSASRRAALLESNSQMAHRALRVLAIALRSDPPAGTSSTDVLETELVFAGLVGMIDPPRDEARVAVSTCRAAGIRPVMITGDHPGTALAVARELGMVNAGDKALPGAELDELSDAELVERVDRIAVYARATAEHKLRIVNAWKARGEIVAMTGDGVNDAPAVRAADIGIAMGITGTDVTKEASAMVLADDNFASIVNAVEEGRGIFDNIQKVLQFLLSCNFGEILLMFVASLLGWPAPLLPIQLLWINLVTDGLPAMALSLEPPEPGIMSRPPRPPRESILAWRTGWMIAVQGLLVGLVGLVAFAIAHRLHQDPERARAVTFCVLVYAELFRALAARSQRLTLFELGLLSNPHLLLAIVVSGLLQVSVAIVPFSQHVFDVPAHSPFEWIVIGLLAIVPVTTIEIVKMLVRTRAVPVSRGRHSKVMPMGSEAP